MATIESERQGFGYKTAWLAFNTDRGDAIVEALKLRNVERVAWDGVARSYESGIYVTPRLGNWTLAVGLDVARRRPDIAVLSTQLAVEVQWFISDRVVELHGWARANAGAITREFEYIGESGEITKNRGELSPIERRLRIPNEDEGHPGPYSVGTMPGEDEVMMVASAWSVDPISISGTDHALGWFGNLE